MIVHTMTYDEIFLEIERDYNIIQHSSTLLRLTEEYIRERTKYKIDKKKDYPVFKKIKSKARNTW